MAQPAKFDAATKTVNQSARKVYDAFPVEAARRAFQGIANRVLGGTDGNALTVCGLAEGTTAASIKTTNNIKHLINAIQYTLAAVDNVVIPALGTQGTACYVKYLVSVGTDGTAGSASGGIEMTKGNEGTSAALAKLPDLPDGKCAIGYFQILTTTAVYVPGTTDNSSAGITDTYVDLNNMPYDL